MNQTVTLKELTPYMIGLLEDGIDVKLTVTGSSMFPLFSHLKTKVTLTKVDDKNIKKGAIPLYMRKNGQYVLHRIVKIKGDSLIMCGDAQVELEYGITKSDIIAVVKSFSFFSRQVSTQSFWHSVYLFIWTLIRPVRPFFIRLINLIRAAIRRLK